MALTLVAWALLSVCQVAAQVCEAPSACEVTTEAGEDSSVWPRPGAALLQTDATLGPGGWRTSADMPARHKASLLNAARAVLSSERRAGVQSNMGPIASAISVIEKDVQILKTSVTELEVNVGTDNDAVEKTSGVAVEIPTLEERIDSEVGEKLLTTSNEPSADIVADEFEAVTEATVDSSVGDSGIAIDSDEEATVAESAVSRDVVVAPEDEVDAAVVEPTLSGDIGVEDDDDLLGPEGEDIGGESLAVPVLEEPSSLLETAQGTVPKEGTLKRRMALLETDVANLLGRTGALENDILAAGSYASLLALSVQGSGVAGTGLKGRVSLLAAKVTDLKKRISILTAEVLG